MTLADWLDDLTVRFILNLPPGELSSVPRLCFQVEEAQWFYEDFVRPAAAAEGDQLPSLNLRAFALLLFQHCPLFSDFTPAQHLEAYEEFMAYKVRVPVRGAILLDESMNHALLVRGWKKGSSWAFPRGKINKDEKDLDCAIREVYEETGYDIRGAGLVPGNEDSAKFIDVTMKGQHVRLYVFRGVPLNTYFEPRTRKEISKIQWYRVQNLPGFKKAKAQVHDTEGEAVNTNKFYMIAPFLGQLKKWIAQQRKMDKQQANTVPEDEQEYEEEGALESDAIDMFNHLQGRDPEAQSIHNGGVPGMPQNANGGNALLAMLQGGPNSNANAPIPQTPLDQVNEFPHQPETPQPQHPKQHAVDYLQAPPQFQYSPAHFQQQQQRPPLPTPSVFGNDSSGIFHGQHGQLPPHLQDLQRQSMQGPFSGHSQGLNPSMSSTNFPQNHSQPRAQPQRPHETPQQLHWTQRMQSEDFGAIGSRTSAPRASEVPMPHLSTHAVSLLNAFKSDVGSTNRQTSINAAQQDSRTGITQQAALLDLFKKPSAAQTPTAPAAEPQMPEAMSPIAPATVEDDSLTYEHVLPQVEPPSGAPPQEPGHDSAPEEPLAAPPRPSAPEIRETFRQTSSQGPLDSRHKEKPQSFIHDGSGSRKVDTLPAEEKKNGKEASGVGAHQDKADAPALPPSQAPKKTGNARREAKPEGRGNSSRPADSVKSQTEQPIQLSHDAPRPSEKNGGPRQLFDPANPGRSAKAKSQDTSKPVTVVERPTSQRQGQPPRSRGFTPARTPPTKPDQNGAPVPSYTILQRPGSAQGKSSESKDAANASTQPQVLKRPMTPAEHRPSPLSASTQAGEGNVQPSGDKKDHLLALLSGKPSPSPTPSNGMPISSPEPPSAPQPEPQRSRSRQRDAGPDAQKNVLLGLFNAPKAPSTTTSLPTAPANAFPTTQPTGPAHRQNALLDLFSKSSSGGGRNSANATPVSPFTLGTPVSRLSGAGLSEQAAGQRESRFNSVVSVGSGSRKGSGSGTPVSPEEQKDFLMGYLNGVIGKEGMGRK